MSEFNLNGRHVDVVGSANNKAKTVFVPANNRAKTLRMRNVNGRKFTEKSK